MLAYAACLLLAACAGSRVEALADYPFRNVSLSWTERVADLVSRLTPEEIVLQLSRGGRGPNGGPAPAVARLGVRPYVWNTECLHGDAEAGNSTSFPEAIGLAAAFSEDLITLVSRATGNEVRAKHNYYVQHGIYADHTGLSCFSPVINIMRHPLWGRNQETYGEDPYLSGVYAANFVAGLQGDHARYILASAGCKHFDAHSGPENIPVPRFSFNAVMSDADWMLTYLPAFRRCVDAGTMSLMCSYNRLNGIPACANSRLLTEVLRTAWGFQGYVVSDEGAIEYAIQYHKYYNDSTEAAAGCINAGTNLELSHNVKDAVYLHAYDALQRGWLKMETLIERIKPLFYTRMRLGEFDPDTMNPYNALRVEDVVQSAEHQNLSYWAAAKAFVLLKNENGFLPLLSKVARVALVGPMTDNPGQLFGDYSADVDAQYISTPLKSLTALGEQASFAAGCNGKQPNHCRSYNSTAVKEAVSGANLAIVSLGIGVALESEGNDRQDLSLPGKQLLLLQDVVASGVPVILLLFSSGPVDVSWAMSSGGVRAIVQCFYPGQAAGRALLDVLTLADRRLNPAGRLPFTWYASMDQVPSMMDYSMTNRTYRYFTGQPLYPFGYGLSYTQFRYDAADVPTNVKAGDDINVAVTLSNIGEYDGDEVVQLYVSWTNSTGASHTPQWQLVGFQRVHIPAAGGSHSAGSSGDKIRMRAANQVTVRSTISHGDLMVWDDDISKFVLRSGLYTLFIGGQQPFQAVNIGSNVLKTSFEVTYNSGVDAIVRDYK